MENYLNSEDEHSKVEEKEEEKILYKMVDGVYQRTLLKKDDAEVNSKICISTVKHNLILNFLNFLFPGLLHLGLPHSSANDEVPRIQKNRDVSLPSRTENRKPAVPGAENISEIPKPGIFEFAMFSWHQMKDTETF